jgi:RimJ/RimL family protein N-acetyltransferase
MTTEKSFIIRPLKVADGNLISAFMLAQSPEYMRFFYAFSGDEEAVTEMLSNNKKDLYAGIFWQENLIGIIFLRGWDEGFEIPSFGYLVSEKYRGHGIFNLVVEYVKVIGRLLGVKTIMAKSNPENTGLKNMIKLGFRPIGVEESTGNTLWHLDC